MQSKFPTYPFFFFSLASGYTRDTKEQLKHSEIGSVPVGKTVGDSRLCAATEGDYMRCERKNKTLIPDTVVLVGGQLLKYVLY